MRTCHGAYNWSDHGETVRVTHVSYVLYHMYCIICIVSYVAVLLLQWTCIHMYHMWQCCCCNRHVFICIICGSVAVEMDVWS